jgi:hypothetical protein
VDENLQYQTSVNGIYIAVSAGTAVFSLPLRQLLKKVPYRSSGKPAYERKKASDEENAKNYILDFSL